MTRLVSIVSTLMFCLAAPWSAAVPVNFADSNLENAVRQAFIDLGSPLGANIDSSDLVGVGFIELDASSSNISNLSGIEFCTDLLILDLGMNAISDVSPLASLTNLINLNLGYGNPFDTNNFPVANVVTNNISNISSLAPLTNLLVLNVGGNPGLTDISVVSNFTLLEQLYLGFQNIASLTPLQNLDNLVALVADGCNLDIGDISAFTDLGGLSILSLNSNFLTTLAPLSTAVNLEILAVSNNQLSNVNVISGFPNLSVLLLSENLLTNLQPLVDNVNIGGDDIVTVSGNPLSQTAACDQIPVIEARFSSEGVFVYDATCSDDVNLNISVVGTGNTIPGEGANSYPPNSSQTILAFPVPGSGFAFDRWQGDVNSTSAATQVFMNGNKNVESVFVSPADHTINLSVTGNGSGSIIPGAGVSSYLNGRNAILSASPDSGSFFGGWSGDISSINTFVQVPMDSNKNITASFASSGFTLNLNQVGQGSMSPGAGVYALATGLQVELSAASTSFGWSFDRWQGDIGGADPNSPTITVTMNQNRSISAIFLLDDFDFILDVNVTGTGSTDPEPGSYGQKDGDIVNLNVVGIPDSGFAFDRWQGDITSTNEFVSLTMDGNKSVEAVFVPQQVTLTLGTAGAGSGSVFPEAGVQGYLLGRTTRLAAFTPPGSFFAGWSGDVISSNPFVDLLMDSNKVVTANFATQGFTLNIASEGIGFTSPAPGSYSYGAGTNVTVSAVELQPNWVFDRWFGNIGTANPTDPVITIPMNQNRSISARFIRKFTLELQVFGPGQTSLDPGIYSLLEQTFVEIEAIPDFGAYFDRWETVNAPLPVPGSRFISVLMNSNKVVRAYFEQADTVLSISVEGQGITSPVPGDYPHDLNEVVMVEAVNVGGTGYFFRRWEGDIGDADPFDPILNVLMSESRAVHAVFEEGLPEGEGEGEGALEGEPAEFICEVLLDQSNVVPPTISSATGSAVFEYFPTPDLIRVTVEHNVVGPTAAVIGRAAPGGNGPFVFNLGNPVSPVEFFMTPEQYEQIDYNHYVMVFSADYLQGEIRGNILCGEPSEEGEGEGGDEGEGEGDYEGLNIEGEEDGTLLCQLPAFGGLMVPMNPTGATGLVTFYTTDDPEQILFRVDHNVSNPTAALVRMGEPGQNGLSIVVNMGDPSSPIRTLISTEDYDMIRQGHYLTIHSFSNLQGAIRADLSCAPLGGEGEGEGDPEGSVEGEGEGDTEGSIEGEGEGDPEGTIEGEGDPEGTIEGEGDPEGTIEGEGDPEGTIEGEGDPEGTIEGEGDPEGERSFSHSADQDQNGIINLSELLRVIQLFNVGSYHCNPAGEDGFGLADGPRECDFHASDYNPGDWTISLSELLRLIQFFNSAGYYDCPDAGTEDGYCIVLTN